MVEFVIVGVRIWFVIALAILLIIALLYARLIIKRKVKKKLNPPRIVRVG